ncbi:MAG TPA: hypothetical protein VLX90_08835 [Steroidobacteraceae bacterium]|nr:hypothetical protein [Steroidobacteraceae bacterium]
MSHSPSLRHWLRLLLLSPLFVIFQAQAEPYLAVQTGFKCGQCHVNPTGGGERTVFGNAFAQTQLAATRIDTGDLWTGEVNRFLSIGGDLRAQAEYTKVPQSPSTDSFDLEQVRVYLNASVIPQRLMVYADEQVAPGGALNREAYGVYWSANHDWYVKAGQMYLPFGLRLQDQTAFVQEITGISMTTPDQGVEFGLERGHWDAQLAITNGTAGGPEVDHGKQYSGQLIYVESLWRLGLAANFNDAAIGSKSAGGIFAGLRTGPVSWLAQADVVDDRSQPAQRGRQLATLVEGNWRIMQGHNLKITSEYLDPNRSVPNDAQTRWSIVYELTPIQYVQLRAGFRCSNGIPQASFEHGRLAFVELHGFF